MPAGYVSGKEFMANQDEDADDSARLVEEGKKKSKWGVIRAAVSTAAEIGGLS